MPNNFRMLPERGDGKDKDARPPPHLPRQPFLDGLRTWASFVVVLYHSNRFFDSMKHNLHLTQVRRDKEERRAMAGLSVALSQWMMFLFFAVAGVSAYCAVQRHYLSAARARALLRRKAHRLLLPLLTGVCFSTMPQHWFTQKVPTLLCMSAQVSRLTLHPSSATPK